MHRPGAAVAVRCEPNIRASHWLRRPDQKTGLSHAPVRLRALHVPLAPLSPARCAAVPAVLVPYAPAAALLQDAPLQYARAAWLQQAWPLAVERQRAGP